MASGTIPCFIEPYQAGETITWTTGEGPFIGQTASQKIIRIMIPLCKPIAEGLTVKLYGHFVAKIGGSSYAIVVGSASSPVTASRTPNGVSYQYTASSNQWTANQVAVLAASGDGPVVLKFV